MTSRKSSPAHSLLLRFIPLVVVFLCASCSLSTDEAPHVLLISIDTLRVDRLGGWGSSRDPAPYLERVARKGTTFTSVRSLSPWTLPSHMSLLTSRSLSAHGVLNEKRRLPEHVATLAESFRNGGYRTGAFVDGGYLRSIWGFDRGFEVYDDRGGHAALIEPRLRTWILSERERPFFAFYHVYDVHTPYQAKEAYARRFQRNPWTLGPTKTREILDKYIESGYRSLSDEEKAQLEVSYMTSESFRESIGKGKKLVRQRRSFWRDSWSGLPTYEAQLGAMLDAYDAGISQADRMIGNLLSWLQVNELLPDTMIVITSDHGEGFMDRGQLSHGQNLNDELLRVPLMVMGPSLPAGELCFVPLTLLDVAPTVLDFARLPVPDPMEGQSLLPLARSETFEHRSAVAEVHNASPRLAVLGEEYKLIHYRRDGSSAIFDLAADPGESTDIAEVDHAALTHLETTLHRFDELYGPEVAKSGNEKELQVEVDPQTREELEALGYLQ